MISPLPYIGGKHYLASRIVEAFPHPSTYDTYVDLFGGAAHVLLARPLRRGHVEVFNDIHTDLVNFWMHCRDDAERLQARLSSLPYSRTLHYQYHKSLYGGEPLTPLERAARWFYVQRSSFAGQGRESSVAGWKAGTKDTGHSDAHAYRSALDLFSALQERLRDVLIDCRDFEKVLASYNKPRTLLYCDPPYIGTEYYYQPIWRDADHERLARLLNASPAYVALSYYPHPALDDWYPADVWYRTTWTVSKHSQRTKERHTRATELLLCNYPSVPGSLWDC